MFEIIVKKILAFDFIIILNVLEFGNINVLNETLFKYYNKGMSSNGLINQFFQAFSNAFFIEYADYLNKKAQFYHDIDAKVAKQLTNAATEIIVRCG